VFEADKNALIMEQEAFFDDDSDVWKHRYLHHKWCGPLQAFFGVHHSERRQNS
jgi:hypothetical protein